jgi:cation:H+ antiporter
MSVVPFPPGSLPDPAVTGDPGLAPFPQPLQAVPASDAGLGLALFAGSLVLLLWASDVFVSAAERLGLSLGVSPYIVGATIVAGGTSTPELVSSVLAVRADASAFVVGNVVGSNVANVCVVLGLAAVAGRRLRVDRELMRVDLPLLTASAAFLFLVVQGGPIEWFEGVLGLVGMAVYVHFTLSTEARLDEVVDDLVDEYAADGADTVPPTPEAVAAATTAGPRTYLALVGGLAVVFVAAELLVRSVLGLAAGFGVGTELVAVTAVAVGTSLPEIAVSVVAVRAGSTEVAIGGVLGSNVFNAFAVAGTASLLGPLAVPESIRAYALPAMLLVTLLYFFMAQDREMTAWEGVTLLVLYVAFLVNLVRFT